MNAQTCPGCSAAMPPGMAFCTSCGATLAQPPAAVAPQAASHAQHANPPHAAGAQNPSKRRGQSLLKQALIGFAIIGVLSLFPIYLLVRSMGDKDDTFQVRRVVALEDGNRLVIQRHGNAREEKNWSRLLLVGARGKVIDEVTDRGGRETMYYGMSPQGAWLENSTSGLHIRSTTNLQKLISIATPKQHPVLSRGYTVVGRMDERLVLKGRDQRSYAVDAVRPIERLPKDAKYLPLPHHSKQFKDFDPVALGSISHIDGKRFDFDKLDLVTPMVVIDPHTHQPQMFESPRGFLVLSVDVVGRGGNHRLSRVSVDGAIAWTVKTDALMGETKLDGKPAFRLAWARINGKTVHTVIEGDVFEGSTGYSSAHGFGRYHARIVDLDANSGATQGRWEITRE